ncbi:hypothetical protein NL676_030311 [Syzygium grande]|nr:hypothetical protein NL676_030311 [Syzygium grande]
MQKLGWKFRISSSRKIRPSGLIITCRTCRDECGVRLSPEEAEAEEEEEALERLAFRQPLPTGTFLMVPPWVQ